mmetsp:Transcript_37520/g.87492  ORF Transcript_37520/g.87492 Transcript_37520/m.87492 type:complete len:341 (+) Transcript_37520:690-1712(+)
MRQARHLGQRPAGHDALLGQHGDAVDHGEQGVDVVGDHHHRQAELLAQPPQQPDELFGAVGVQPRGGLVEEQQLRVQDQGARQRHPLDHAARQLGRALERVRGLEAHLGQLEHDQRLDQAVGHAVELAQRQRDVVEHIQRREQRAMLEQHAPAVAHPLQVARGAAPQRVAEDLHAAGLRHLQAEQQSQQGGLARPRAADQGHHLAAVDGQVQPAVDDMAVQHGGHTVDFDDGVAAVHGSDAHIGEQHREDGIDDDDQRDRGDDRLRDALAQAFGVGLDAQPEVAGQQRDQPAEQHRFAPAQPEVGRLHDARQHVQELQRVQAQLHAGRRHAAQHHQRRGP